MGCTRCGLRLHLLRVRLEDVFLAVGEKDSVDVFFGVEVDDFVREVVGCCYGSEEGWCLSSSILVIGVGIDSSGL